MFRLLEKYRNSPAHKYINSSQLEEDLKEAAKKMTNEEAIRLLHRDTTREAVAELEYYAGFNKEKTIEQIQEAMDMGAEALKQTTWVPCSERLPDDDICALVTVNGKHNNITFKDALQIGSFSADEGWIIDGFADWTTPDVIAWMPLPEPYKEAIRND